MPRDDLSINGHFANMPPPPEQLDAAAVVEEFTNRAANLHNEIAFMNEEILAKDMELKQVLDAIKIKDSSIQRWIRTNGSHVPNPREEQYRKQVQSLYDQADVIQAGKVALSSKALELPDKHTRWLDNQIKILQERGDFPVDETLPSTLRPQASLQTARPVPSASLNPLGQVPSQTGPLHVRHPNQHPQRPQALTQGLQLASSGASASTPTTPSAAAILLNRQQREASLGASAASAKRQKLTGGIGTVPTHSSGLARPSTTPGTPRAGTPVRSGSIGPRAQKAVTGNKKVAPQGSRQSGVPRKNRPGKSGLNRVRGTVKKNSPSSTNGSELSDANSDSMDEDEPGTPPPVNRDEEMADADEEEGGDDKKYCICQSVSYGDMVACDNDDCKLEWFHWSCVGLKSEPVGNWICPLCTKIKNMKK